MVTAQRFIELQFYATNVIKGFFVCGVSTESNYRAKKPTITGHFYNGIPDEYIEKPQQLIIANVPGMQHKKGTKSTLDVLSLEESAVLAKLIGTVAGSKSN